MTEIVNRRRNIYINSEQYHSANGDVNLILPGNDFAVDKNEHMRLSLESFTMARRFYNVNSNNNLFYIRDLSDAANPSYTPITIETGDYNSFDRAGSSNDALCSAIQTALTNANFAGSVVTFNHVKKTIIFDMTSAANFNNDCDFVCFQVTDSSVAPTSVSTKGIFNDSCELLGGRPTKSTSNIISAFKETGNNTKIFNGIFPACLFTLEAIHLRTNLQTHSYQTPNFDANTETSTLMPSDIFAKIHITQHDSLVDTHAAPISFVDSGSDAFSVDLQNKTLPGIILKLTDDKGRPLDSVDNQFTDGNLSFLATLKWSAISQPMIGREIGMPSSSMQMKLYQAL